MAKYRLRCRQNGGTITLMEIDTESRAWYIQAEDRAAALHALSGMGAALIGVEEILINGEDVTEAIFRRVPHEGLTLASSLPEEAPLPEEEPLCGEEIPLPDDEQEGGYRPPTPEDILAASCTAEEPEEVFDEAPRSGGFAMPGGLPSLHDVLSADEMRPAAKKDEKKAFSGIFIGKKPIRGEAVPISSITEETDGAVIQGTLVSFDSRELRDNKKLYILKVADDTNGMNCKRFFDNAGEAEAADKNLKTGMTVRIRGNVRIDKFSGGLTMNIVQMEKGETKKCGWSSTCTRK